MGRERKGRGGACPTNEKSFLRPCYFRPFGQLLEPAYRKGWPNCCIGTALIYRSRATAFLSVFKQMNE